MDKDTTVSFKLSPDDQATYGGGDTWYSIDMTKLGKIRAGILEEFEESSNIMVGEIHDLIRRKSFRAMKGVIWLARRKAGCEDRWDQFSPDLDGIEWDSSGTEDGDEGNVPGAPANREERRAAARRKSPASGS